jgi:enoyl-CoA hydratase/carnithine racemase
MEYQNIIFSVENGIAIITLNRPKAYNALCRSMNLELEDAITRLEDNLSVRVLIITGGSKAFAAGADITEIMDATPAEAERIALLAQSINNRLEGLRIPVIAAICGFALGGGLELALACDFRVAGENSIFGLPEVSLGILPGAGGTQRLTNLLGAAKAKEMILLGKRLRGFEALEVGLINDLAANEEVMACALKMAEKIIAMPGMAVGAGKQVINFCVNYGSGVGRDYEKQHFTLLFSTEDRVEGLHAVIEKRQPVYKNR